MHEQAVALFRTYALGPFMTSNHVRGETWTVLRSRGGQPIAVSFLDALESSPRTTVAFVDEGLEQEALRWLRRHDERVYSFVDATSFLLMRSLSVRDVLTFDQDFAAAGLRVLRA